MVGRVIGLAALLLFACERERADVEIVVPERIAVLHAQVAADGSVVIDGKDGVLFFAPELRFLAAGRFWGDRAVAVSKAAKPEWADPLPAIVDFHEQLASQDIDLLVVPVPAKATIQAHALPGDAGTAAGERNDPAFQAFLDVLRDEGVRVVDLAPLFLDAEARGVATFAKTDTHWSPAGMAIAMEAIADELADMRAMPCGYTLDLRPLEPVQIVGDLTKLRGGADLPVEMIDIEVIDNAATCFDRQSPLVLMGDSHVLVYSAGGDLHAKDAGLPEHLSRRVAEPIDLIGVRGSGASATRIDLLRRKDGMAGKNWVVWVFAARDFTESDGWRLVPVIPK